jgi:hypothetical protein
MLDFTPKGRGEHPEPQRVGSLPGRPGAPLTKRRAGFEGVEVAPCGHNGLMTRQSTLTRHWNSRAIVFLVLAIVGLVGTWTYNIIAIIEQNDFLGDWFNNGPAVGSLTTDLLIMAVAACVLIVIEGRRLGMKHLWAYIVFSGLTAIAFTFPLFLANRERRLQQLASESGD